VVVQEGKIDFFFNNAGIGLSIPAHQIGLDQWHKVLGVNLMGMVHGCEIVYKQLVKQGHGHLVNTASLAGLVPFPTAVPYATSKFAMVGLSRSLRIEAAFYGVKVSAICPGFVDTAIYDQAIRVLPKNELMKGIPFPLVPLSEAVHLILRGVQKNKEIIIFPTYARVLWWLVRYCKPLSNWVARDTFRKYLALSQAPN
jgi:short-subunit dehydrogenase